MPAIIYPELLETFDADIIFPTGEHFQQETFVYAGPNRFYFEAKGQHCLNGAAQIQLTGHPTFTATITGPSLRNPNRFFVEISG